jgi:hypothetical protein
VLRRWIAAGCALAAVLSTALTASLVRRPAGEAAGNPVIAGAGPDGPVGPVERACDGVPLRPSDDLQRIIDAHAPGTAYCFSAGTYRLEEPLRPKSGDALIGRAGAVVSGSKVLTGWRRGDRGWSTTGFLPAAPGTHGECRADMPLCGATEDVFADKQRLTRVSSPADVIGGTFHADYATNTITIGDDPARHLLEQAVAPSLVRTTADDVTVANLVFEQAANEAQTAAVESRQVTPQQAGSGWHILHNEVRLNHGAGLGIADGAVVSGNFVHDQGQLGVGAWGTGSVVDGNEISSNGVAGYSPDWEAGGVKSWLTDGQSVTHNYVHDNAGPGLWSDGGNIRTRYAANRISGNWGAGIQYEISYDATIEDNEITGNGRRPKGWAWDAGIQIQSSGGTGRIEITGNVVSGNANAITLIDSGGRAGEAPAPHGPHVVRNVSVHDNRITLTDGQLTGAVQDIGDPAIYRDRNNRFEKNTYRLASGTAAYFAWNDTELDWAGWRAQGQDAGSTVTRTR